MSPANLLTEWARLLIGSLRTAGVRDVVLSPGSRSTPFTWAALQDDGLRCRAIIDERSAAFFAVGQARLSGDPVLLICTSGSAAANYFPAVVEAAESATPLLLLTADRPFELQHAAAPQTIDQTRLYGDYARRYFELGMPDAEPAMLQALPRIAAQAVLAARSPRPGPVHLNARARKPLEPAPASEGDGGDDGEARRLGESVDRLLVRGPTRARVPDLTPNPEAVRDLADACRRARRGIIVCGPASAWQAARPTDVAALARATGFPVVPEAASQQRFTPDLPADHVIDAFGTLLGSARFRADQAPDLVIQLGRPPTAAGWDAYLREWADAERVVVWPYGWADPRGSATALIPARLEPTVRALVAALEGAGGSDTDQDDRAGWLAALRHANGIAWSATDAVLAEGYTEGGAVRAVVDHVPDGGVLALGNSLPIRHADAFLRADTREVTVWSQRGANGIDGLVSGAAGAAAAGRPTTLIVGDVSFLHDIGGLRAARDLPAPLTILVLNNGGGRIFELLPIADTAGPVFDEAWLTPPGVDFGAAAAAFGLRHARCPTRESLAAALDDARAERGTIVVEALLPEGATTRPAREILERIEAELA